MHDVRSLEPRQRERERRRDSHPAVAQRRPQVVHGRAVDDLDPRGACRAPAEVDDRRRDDVDLVAALYQSAHELARRRHGPAERARRPPNRCCKEDAQTIGG